jgi:hypothetical protein
VRPRTRPAIIWRAGERPKLDGRRRHVGVRRIVDITSPVATIEGRTIVAVERQPPPEPFRQVGVRDEVAAERNKVRVTRRDDGRRTLARKTAGSDQCAAERWPQMLGRKV